ncbi:MAG: hypothetical protein WA432_00800 [Candidatus Babeliaceae bacterium]
MLPIPRPLGRVSFNIFNKLYCTALCALLACVPLLVKHRGIFHNIWFIIFLNGILLSFVYLMVPHCMMAAVYDSSFFLLGALSHLLLDKGYRRFLRR